MAYVTKNIKPNKVAISAAFADDPFYRYRIDQLLIEHNQQYGGVTKLITFEKFCKALHTEPKQLQKYLARKLGTTCKLLRGTWVISGIHDITIISNIIEDYIEKYILCHQCWMPELVAGVCSACGKSQ